MKKVFLSIFLLSFYFLFAENLVVPKNHLLVTDQGIFFMWEETLLQAESISYLGNSLYEVTRNSHCGRCGWPINDNGKCTNQNCNQYGPRERD